MSPQTTKGKKVVKAWAVVHKNSIVPFPESNTGSYRIFPKKRSAMKELHPWNRLIKVAITYPITK